MASLGFVTSLTLVGVTGFASLEHESLIDALLTTISAISTVGYSPPHPLTTAGKVLALLLIVGGLVGITLVISTVTEYFIEGNLPGVWERRKMDKTIAQLRNHFIISGFGRVGREVAKQFDDSNVPFVVVDINEHAISVAQAAGYPYIREDASHDQILQQAGIDRAAGLIACADSDTNNVYVTLSARAVKPDIFIVARAAQPEAEAKLFMAGATRVVSPYVMAGQHMAELASRPMVADQLSLQFDGKPIDVNIRELAVEPGSELIGVSIRDLHGTLLDGAFVLALDREGKRITVVSPEVVLQSGDHLLVVGSGH